MPKLTMVKNSFLINFRVLISYMAIGFSNSSPKYPNKAILALNLFFFFNMKFCVVANIEGADFKYDNSFTKFQSKNTEIRQFCS